MSVEFSESELEKIINTKVKQELKTILNFVQDGVFITDGEGNVLMLNQASLDLCTYSEEELVGRNMRDMVNEQMFEDSLSIKAIETGQVVSTIQKGISDKYDILVTAVPVCCRLKM